MSLNVLKTVIEAGGEEKLLIDGTEMYPGYHIDFDRDQYLDTLYKAFVGTDGFKQGEREDFNIGPYGFYLDTFSKCLAKLTQWRELRMEPVSWEEIAKKYPNKYRRGQ